MCITRATAEEAVEIMLELCKARGAKAVTKGKSMISEEIGLNAALEARRDRGGRDRSRRIHHPAARRGALAHHRARRSMSPRTTSRPISAACIAIFPPDRDLSQPEQLLAEARGILRDKFLSADIGVTGANFLVAETGTSIIVTNEGNGDLTQILPKVHIVLASLEKIVPTLDDAAQIAARAGALGDRPGHVGLYDAVDRPAPAGRSRRAGGISRRPARQRPLGDARRRVRGHAALHPLRRLHEPLPGLSRGRRPRLRLGLSRADGRRADALADRRRRGRPIAERVDLLRALRGGLPDAHSAAQDDAPLARARVRAPSVARDGALRASASGRSSPSARRSIASRPISRCARCISFGRARGRFSSLPFAGGWTRYRDLPAPQGATFQSQWRAKKRSGAMSARDEILAAIRRSLHVTGEEAPRRAAVGLAPRRGAGRRRAAARAGRRRPSAPRRSRPRRSARQASVAEVARRGGRSRPRSRASCARTICRRRLRMGDDARLAAMPWAATALEIAHGASDGHDLNAVSAAFAAVAETGTLALVSGPDNPTTLNFLPDNHFVVVFAERCRRRLRERLRQVARAPTARARCRARSISSPARRARPTSSRPCCLGRMGRGGCIS